MKDYLNIPVSNNLSLFYYSVVFFIISLSEAVYLCCFDWMCDGFVFNTHTHICLFKFIIAMYMYVCIM